MSAEFLNDQWRIPNNKNKNKFSKYSIDSTLTTGVNIGSRLGTHPRAMNTPWTISAWIYIPEGTDSPFGYIYKSMVLVGTSAYTGIALQITDSSSSGYGLNIRAWKQNVRNSRYSRVQTTANSPTGLARGQWHHIVCADDGVGYRSPSYSEGTNTTSRGWRFYINNVVSGSDIIGNSSLQPLGDVINDTPGDILVANTSNILISDVAFYAHYLEADQVSTLYGSGTAMGNPMAVSPKPLNYWKLGDSVYNGANYLVPNSSLNGYFFNFDNQYMQTQSNTPSALNGATSLSISAWVRFNTVSSGSTTYVQTIASNWESGEAQYLLRYMATSSNPYLQFYLHDGTNSYIATRDVVLGTDAWYLVTGVWDGSNIRVYISYSQGSDVSFSGPLNTNSNSDKIGSYSTNQHLLEGSVLNLGIWKNTALTYTQIREIYGLNPNTLTGASPRLIDLVDDFSGPNPTVYYKLTGNDGTFDSSTGNWTINDSIGNRDAVSVGMNGNNLIQDDTGFIKSSVYGYSPYALDFSGITAHLKTNTIPAATNTVTLSAWVKRTGDAGQYAGVFGVRNTTIPSPSFGLCWQISFGDNDNKIRFRTSSATSSAYQEVVQNSVMPDNTWTHVTGVADGANLKIYINGTLQTDTKGQSNGTLQSPTSNIFFGMQSATSSPFNGQLSNCARWNVGLTQAQVTEIYNQGVPSNLNTFSGTAPIGWWQLGSNSSFNTNWTCLDEIGTDNAVSAGSMTNDDIVDGPGYSGIGIGDSAIKIVGSAPYSTANGLSENMDVLDRTTDVPS